MIMLKYQACCLGWSIISRGFRNEKKNSNNPNNNNNNNNSIVFPIEDKGL